MSMMTWMALDDALSPAALTVRAQTLSPNDEGKLLWDTFMPREDVNSIELDDVTTLDYRPVADRREWDARGRLIPAKTPTRRKVSIIPIESRDQIAEKEMQILRQSGGGNSDVIRQLVGVDVPSRVDRLAMADYRRLEVDAFTAWTAGTITQRNPETGATYVASFGFDTARINAALTDWDVAASAYDELLAWITAAEDKVGPIKGAMLRLSTLNAILADAPNLQNSVKMTRTELADRISQDRGSPFAFFVNENTAQVFTDGGLATATTKIWPAETIAAVPSDGRIGRTVFAPVIRAMDLAQTNGSAGVDVRGVTVFYEESNGGRLFTMEAQLNAVPVPEEGRLYVSTVGV